MATKHIIVTGGVVSSLGKGIISSSIGKLLQSRGYSVTIQKFDPYINIDPGTLNPYEHGECYVTSDGTETDLDLGHYERFTGIRTGRMNSLTTGRIFKTVIERERKGDYLGKTIQIVPHITDEIKRNISVLASTTGVDFVITEIGGTIGDIESAPFMEAIRQFKWEQEGNVLNVHLTYVPYLCAAGEFKTKPTQHSVKELQGDGIQPDILILRTEKHLDRHLLDKVSSFCNVAKDCVFQSENLPSIYEVPLNMQAQGLDTAILRCLGMDDAATVSDMTQWKAFVDKYYGASRSCEVALVGKYDLQDAYKSIREALVHAATHQEIKVNIRFVNSENIDTSNVGEALRGCAGVIICPGFGTRGTEGKIEAARYAREHDIPALGICFGMQMMVIEFARNVLGYADANSNELDPQTCHNVIDMMQEQKTVTALGGTMLLGEFACRLASTSLARRIYGTDVIYERHRHRYEFNSAFREAFEAAGMKCSGINPDSGLVEIVEVPSRRWYVGTQFHPEYSSTVLAPHPLFVDFVKACNL